jgi:hypothetical protein
MSYMFLFLEGNIMEDERSREELLADIESWEELTERYADLTKFLLNELRAQGKWVFIGRVSVFACSLYLMSQLINWLWG